MSVVHGVYSDDDGLDQPVVIKTNDEENAHVWIVEVYRGKKSKRHPHADTFRWYPASPFENGHAKPFTECARIVQQRQGLIARTDHPHAKKYVYRIRNLETGDIIMGSIL